MKVPKFFQDAILGVAQVSRTCCPTQKQQQYDCERWRASSQCLTGWSTVGQQPRTASAHEGQASSADAVQFFVLFCEAPLTQSAVAVQPWMAENQRWGVNAVASE